MATTADSPSSPTVPAGRGGENINSPQFRRKNLQSPWAQVVRGQVNESLSLVHSSPSSSSLSTTSQPEQTPFSDSSPPKTASPSLTPDYSSAGEGSDVNNGNAAPQKKQAWNKHSNRVEVGPVMDAVSWPALSESTKAFPKSSADSSSKIVTDVTVSSTQGPVITYSPQKQATSSANPSSTTNHTLPFRQRSMKRGGGGNTRGGPAQSGFAHPPPPPPFPVFQMPPNGYPNMVPGVPDPSYREFPYRSSNWETRPVGGYVSQSHSSNDHRSSSRRGSFGPHQRGDGHYHNSHGGRRDPDRGGYGNARDVHLHPQRAPPRGFVRPPPPNTAAFVTPPPVRPFVNPMGYPEFYYIPTMPMEPFRPFIAHAPPPPLLIPVAEPSLSTLIVNQIEYYFSDENLVKDDFLRSNMDDQGWVLISLIASFRRVKILTADINFILDSLKASTLVEVQDDKVRRRSEWKKWIPASALPPSEPGFVSPNNSSYDMLSTSFQKIAVEEVDAKRGGVTVKADSISEAVPGRRLTNSYGESHLPNGEISQNTSSKRN
ncbi:hypothetical protein I3760_07G144200 [Carya illinoinensis]|nr:hypothetical protein I3760_07G144200 [Carya illinoinensis]